MSELKGIRELIDDETLDEISSVMMANGYLQEWNDLMDHSRLADERIEAQEKTIYNLCEQVARLDERNAELEAERIEIYEEIMKLCQTCEEQPKFMVYGTPPAVDCVPNLKYHGCMYVAEELRALLEDE